MLPTILALGVAALGTIHVEAQETSGRTTAAEEAAIKDPAAECEPYYYGPVATALASFPAIWQPATLLDGDANAKAKWASIQASVPDIPPKGTMDGKFTGLNYPADDPDCWWTFGKCTQPKAAGVPPDVSTMPEPRTLGYGFDDGPNCSHNAFYDYLQQQNQKATMFYIGSNVMDWPLETQRAVADGHEICIHSWSHRYMTAFASEDAFAELYYTGLIIPQMEAVKLAAGVTPTCWRPPFGDVDDRIRAIANGLGLRTIGWSYDSQDWQVGVSAGIDASSVDKEYETMIQDAKAGKFDNEGTIILMHELNDFTMDEAVKYYEKLKDAFQHIVPVAVGLNITQPYVESNITFPNFAQYIAGSNNLIANLTAVNSTSSPSRVSGAALAASSSAPSASASARINGASSSYSSDLHGSKVFAVIALGYVVGIGMGFLPL